MVKLAQRISDIIESTQPTFTEDLKSSPIIKEAITALQWLLRIEKKTGEKVHGVEALKFILEETESKAKNNSATLEDLTPLVVYGWLLPEDSKEGAENIISLA